MPLVAAPAASAAQATRKPSLKEQPSYLKVLELIIIIMVVRMVFVVMFMLVTV